MSQNYIAAETDSLGISGEMIGLLVYNIEEGRWYMFCFFFGGKREWVGRGGGGEKRVLCQIEKGNAGDFFSYVFAMYGALMKTIKQKKTEIYLGSYVDAI